MGCGGRGLPPHLKKALYAMVMSQLFAVWSLGINGPQETMVSKQAFWCMIMGYHLNHNFNGMFVVGQGMSPCMKEVDSGMNIVSVVDPVSGGSV